MKTSTARDIHRSQRASYDRMAEDFSRTRAVFWPELAFLTEHVGRDDRVLDIGCGNGRLAPLIASRHAKYTGIDSSERLLALAESAYPTHHFLRGEATRLPFSDNSFDAVFLIAVLHHIPSDPFRKRAMLEAARVLSPGGILIMTVWDLWRAKHIPSLLRSAFQIIRGQSDLEIGDLLLTFGPRKEPRFVHAFTQGEVARLCQSTGFSLNSLGHVARPSGERNIVAIAAKVHPGATS